MTPYFWRELFDIWILKPGMPLKMLKILAFFLLYDIWNMKKKSGFFYQSYLNI